MVPFLVLKVFKIYIFFAAWNRKLLAKNGINIVSFSSS